MKEQKVYGTIIENGRVSREWIPIGVENTEEKRLIRLTDEWTGRSYVIPFDCIERMLRRKA